MDDQPMKFAKLPLLILFILLLAACGSSAEPTAVPEATAVIAEAPPSPTVTIVIPTLTATAVPATATLVPEPATATAVPTITTEAPTSDATESATAESTSDATATDATAVATESTTTAATTAAATESSATATPATTATTTAPVAPPPSGDVPAPTDNNYPEWTDKTGWENRINVPEGFNVTYMGQVTGNPTSITFGPDGKLYIATQLGSILVMDQNGNLGTYATGFNTPTGLAFRPGTNQLYVSSRILNENVGGESKVSIVNGPDIITGIPCCYTFFHAANGIEFGPDGMGYVGVGGRADHGEILDGPNAGQMDELHPWEASILRFNPDTGAVTNYATGFRNPYDIAFDSTGQLWASDNTPDFDPPERLHKVVPGGQHGYPYYECDVCFSPPPGVNVIPPLVTFAPSSSPTGVLAYKGNQIPGYNNNIFVALWSSFPGAQKIMRIGAGGSAPTNFATGFAAPIDLTQAPDGSIWVADWATGIIFKLSYGG
jgi:glucose/arabinose dehydrogenase